MRRSKKFPGDFESLEIEEDVDSILDSEEGIGLIDERAILSSASSFEYNEERRRPYRPLYIAAALILLFLIVSIVYVPNHEGFLEQSCAYTDEQLETFLETIDRMPLKQRCIERIGQCHCFNPLKPSPPINDPAYETKWQEAAETNLALASDAAVNRTLLDVVLLGDSITEHWQGTAFGKRVPKHAECAQVYHELFTRSESAVQGLALGIAGDRCAQVLQRIVELHEVNGLNPSVWWLLIGTNDYATGDFCHIDNVVAGNIQIVRTLQALSNATVVINSLLPVGKRRNGFQLEEWEAYSEINQRLQCYATGTEKVHFFNATPIFWMNATHVNETLLPDGVHPSAFARRIWGQAIVDKVLAVKRQKEPH